MLVTSELLKKSWNQFFRIFFFFCKFDDISLRRHWLYLKQGCIHDGISCMWLGRGSMAVVYIKIWIKIIIIHFLTDGNLLSFGTSNSIILMLVSWLVGPLVGRSVGCSIRLSVCLFICPSICPSVSNAYFSHWENRCMDPWLQITGK